MRGDLRVARDRRSWRAESGRASEAGSLMALVVAWALVSGGCRPKTNAYAPPPPPEVTVAHPISKPVTEYLESTATTEAYESVELRARVAGFLDQVNFKPGSPVKKGDLLFVIDPRVYEAQAQQADADLQTRRATLRLAELTLTRVQEASKGGAASQQEMDRAAAEYDQAKAQVDLAEAALANAKLNVEFTQVRAPIDGRISKNLVDVGNLVGASGQPTILATIVNNRPIYVTVDASERDVITVRHERLTQAPGAEPGQIAPGVWRPVDLATSDSDEFNVHGHIDYVDPALNPQTGTIRVRSRFENENNDLLPGMFVRVRFLLKTVEATVVPDTALLADQSGRYALVVADQDKVELRRVKIGVLDGSMRQVLEGLSAGDRVIVNGLQRARPGMVVKPTLTELSASGAGAPKPGAPKPDAAKPDASKGSSPSEPAKPEAPKSAPSGSAGPSGEPGLSMYFSKPGLETAGVKLV